MAYKKDKEDTLPPTIYTRYVTCPPNVYLTEAPEGFDSLSSYPIYGCISYNTIQVAPRNYPIYEYMRDIRETSKEKVS